MYRNILCFKLFLFSFLISFSGIAQVRDSVSGNHQDADTSDVIIGKITVIGNKITKDHIILRELAFQPGDTLSPADFDAKRKRSEENLYNTSLFNSAKLTY